MTHKLFRQVSRHHHHLSLGLVAALYILTLLSLCAFPKDILDGFIHIHTLASNIALDPPADPRLPILGPLRLDHLTTEDIDAIVTRGLKFTQDHHMGLGEPWVKAVGTLGLRQVRNRDLNGSIYGQNCDWEMQDKRNRPVVNSITPSAWTYSEHTGLPHISGSWCVVPEGGYYLGLQLHRLANHEACRTAPEANRRECVRELVSKIGEELISLGWVDDLTSTLTLSLTMFDFRHGLMCSLTVVAEKVTAASWSVLVRTFVVYPWAFYYLSCTLAVAVLICILDLFSKCIPLLKRLLLLALDALIIITISIRLSVHFKESNLLYALTKKYIDELEYEVTESGRPFGEYQGIELLSSLENTIRVLEIIWILLILLKILSLEWYCTKGMTLFVLIFRRGLKRGHNYILTLLLLTAIHALAFYTFFGDWLDEFTSFDTSFSAMVGYTVGTLNHQEFLSLKMRSKLFFLTSAFTLYLLGEPFVITWFMSSIEAMNEVMEEEEKDEEEEDEEGMHEDLLQNREELGDQMFLRIVKEEIRRFLGYGKT